MSSSGADPELFNKVSTFLRGILFDQTTVLSVPNSDRYAKQCRSR